MNIVDTCYITHKYINKYYVRHVSFTNNISFWLKLNSAIDITKNRKNILIKNKRHLNQLDIETISMCTIHHINIIPILYRFQDHCIKFLIIQSLKYKNIFMLKIINNYVSFNVRKFININYLVDICMYGRTDIIKFLHKNNRLSKECFLIRPSYFLGTTEYDKFIFICCNCYINVIKYLHKNIGFTKQDFQSINNLICCCVCQHGLIDIVVYLHKRVGLTKKDFQSENNYACRRSFVNNYIDVVKYLHKEVKLNASDFELNNNSIDLSKHKYEKLRQYFLNEVN